MTTIRELREILFHLENQDMTIGELRSMLFMVEEQDKELEIGFAIWKKIEADNKQSMEAGGEFPIETQEEEKAPSFFAQHGRKPIPGKDFDPEGALCRDDYEYFTGTGRYSDSDSSVAE